MRALYLIAAVLVTTAPEDAAAQRPANNEAAAGECFTGRAFSHRSPTEELRGHALENPMDHERKRALEILRRRLPAEEFIALCDEILSMESAASMCGWVAHQRHLADPASELKEPLFPPSIVASRERENDPGNPKWKALDAYLAVLPTRTLEELHEDFTEHGSDDRAEILIRWEIVRHIRTMVSPGTSEAQRAQQILQDMFRHEPDAGIRHQIVVTLGVISEPGDEGVAEFLEGQLASEPNIRLVRSIIVHTVNELRSGGGLANPRNTG